MPKFSIPTKQDLAQYYISKSHITLLVDYLIHQLWFKDRYKRVKYNRITDHLAVSRIISPKDGLLHLLDQHPDHFDKHYRISKSWKIRGSYYWLPSLLSLPQKDLTTDSLKRYDQVTQMYFNYEHTIQDIYPDYPIDRIAVKYPNHDLKLLKLSSYSFSNPDWITKRQLAQKYNVNTKIINDFLNFLPITNNTLAVDDQTFPTRPELLFQTVPTITKFDQHLKKK